MSRMWRHDVTRCSLSIDALLSLDGCFGIFVKIVARWVYKTTRVRCHDVMRCSLSLSLSRLMLWYLCKIVARWVYKTTRMWWHDVACCYYLLYHLAKLLKKVVASQKNKTNQWNKRMLLLSFVSSCKVVTKEHSIPETNTSHVATIFCYHAAKLLQKLIAYQKPTHRMLLLSFVIMLQSCYKR